MEKLRETVPLEVLTTFNCAGTPEKLPVAIVRSSLSVSFSEAGVQGATGRKISSSPTR
jgi:hypothetical protein